MLYQQRYNHTTHGRGTYNITHGVDSHIQASGIQTGLCNLFVHHTSASLIITENADPAVRKDIETILQRLAPDGDPAYLHDYEGDDDMSAHIRCVLTNDSLSLPVTNGRCALGTWQGIFLYEHRTSHFERQLTVTVMGE